MQRTDFQVPPFLCPTFPDEDTAEYVMSLLHRPVDFFSVAKASIDAATNFIIGSPDDYHPGDEVEIEKGLDSICHGVPIQIDIEYLDCVWYTLQIMAIALLLRHTIFGRQVDLDEYNGLRETLGPGDKTGRDMFVGSYVLNAYLMAQSEPSNELHPLDFPDPINNIVSQTTNAIHILWNTPPDSRSPEHQTRILTNVEMLITVLDSAVERYDPDDGRLLEVFFALATKGEIFFHRYMLLEDPADLDLSIFSLEISRSFCDTSSSSHSDFDKTSLLLLDALVKRREITDVPIDSGHIINSGHIIELIEHFLLLGESEERTCSSLTAHLDDLWEVRRDPAQRYLLADAMIPPAVTEDGRSWCTSLGALVVLDCSDAGGKVADWRRALQWVELEQPHAIGHFLVLQLKIAVTTGDEEAALDLEQEIHKRGHSDYTFRALPTELKDPDAKLDSTIETFKSRFRSCSSKDDVRYQPTTLVLFILLHDRYTRTHQVPDLRDALNFRLLTSLPKLGTSCLDLVLLDSCQNDLDPGGTTGRLSEIRGLHFGVLHCDKCVDDARTSSWKSKPEWLPGVKESGKTALVIHLWASTQPSLQASEQDNRGFNSHNVAPTGDLPFSRVELLLRINSLIATKTAIDRDSRGTQLQHEVAESRKEATKYLEQLYDSFKDSEGEQDGEEGYYKMMWANGLLCFSGPEFEGPNATPSPQISLALDYLREFATDALHLPHQERLFAIRHWFEYLPWPLEENKEHVLVMAQLALSLMQEQSSASTSVRTSIDTRLGTAGLLINAAAVTALSGPENILSALGILDAGQSLLWRQGAGVRSLLDRSALVPAESFVSNEGTESQQPSIPAAIRPNFYEDLSALSRYGPIVVLFPDPPIAVIFREGRRALVLGLQISMAMIQELHRVFRSSVRTRAEDSVPSENGASDDTVSASYHTDPDSLATPPQTPGAEFSRSLRRKVANNDDATDALGALWRGIAWPVLDAVLSDQPVAGTMPGRNSNWNEKLVKPDPKDRSRIWWCCLGDLSFMPIHAAGIYHGSSPICVSDFFVSSYTPSIGALIDAWKRPVPDPTSHLKVLVAIQPNPGAGWTRLPEVGNELREIVGIVPGEDIVTLNDCNSSEPDFDGVHTTVKNVVDKLPEANVLHIACHGTQDIADPLSSGFILANGERLTIEELMKYNLPNAHIAILSACHTASNDTELPEDSINLASAMLSLGFRSVLATKWPMSDSDGPVVAKAVYSKLHLLAGPQLADEAPELAHGQDFSLAQIVDEIARDLRTNRKLPVARWATFVHVGV